MRKVMIAIVLAGHAISAAAAGVDELDARNLELDTYSARMYYRLDFGGPAAHSQSVGLRFDNGMTARRDAPALLQASLDSSGITSVSLRGLQLRGAQPAAAADDDRPNRKKGFWTRLSTGEWVAIGFSAAVLLAAVGQAAGGGGNDVNGTGGS